MLHNYWITALRSFKKRLSSTFILFMGLTVGVTSFIFISIFIHYERSFDRFHTKGDRIFRIQQNRYNKNELTNSSVNSNLGIGKDMLTDFPEVERYTIFLKNTAIISYGPEVIIEEKSAYVSNDFFKIFSFNLLKGNDSLVLAKPYTVALSETLARKIFKDEDPIGKMLRYKGKLDVEVTGVFQDLPENSHIDFNILISFETYNKLANKLILEEPWRWDGFYTYILLRENSKKENIESKILDIIERKTGSWLRETDQKLEINLQPLFDIHLKSNFSDEISPGGSQQTVLFLGLIAIALLTIAWVNYISLATVQSLTRAKEVGIRKVLGGIRIQLIKQFLTEAFILNFFSFILALLIIFLAFPDFTNLVERNISTDFFKSIGFYAFALGLLTVSTLLSGLYPAFILSAVSPSEILKGKFISTKKGKLFRKVTVFLPFLVTVVLLVGLFVVYHQIEFLKNQELGFDPTKKLVVRDSEIYDSLYKGRLEVFKKEVTKITGVENMTYVSSLMGEPIILYSNSVQRIGTNKEDVNQYRFFSVDENFIDALQLSLLAGRSFSATSTPDKDVIVNETASKLLGFQTPEDAVDQKVFFRDDTATVRAVLQDYHHEAPKVKIPPTFYVYDPSGGFYFILPVNNTKPQIINSVRKLFSEIFPGQPFTYYVLDEKYGSQYQTDEKFEQIISMFTFILLFVTCTGIFSLSSYMAKLRTKEIGIRKVLGASTIEIIYYMLKEYILIVGVAIAIGLPLAFVAIEKWLQSFSLHVTISWWMLAAPSFVILIIAILTVLGQTIKATNTNPAEVLQTE